MWQVSARPDVLDDPCRDPKYLETAVDTMRSQKDEVSQACDRLKIETSAIYILCDY